MDELRQDFFHSRMPFLSLTWLKIGPNDLAFDQPRTNPQGSGWSDTLHYRECRKTFSRPIQILGLSRGGNSYGASKTALSSRGTARGNDLDPK